MPWSPSIVPRGNDRDIYLVVDDLGRHLGRVWREADVAQTDYETVIKDLLAGQYKNPVGIFGFNPVEGWSHDVSADSPRSCGAAAISKVEIYRHRSRIWSSVTRVASGGN